MEKQKADGEQETESKDSLEAKRESLRVAYVELFDFIVKRMRSFSRREYKESIDFPFPQREPRNFFSGDMHVMEIMLRDLRIIAHMRTRLDNPYNNMWLRLRPLDKKEKEELQARYGIKINTILFKKVKNGTKNKKSN
ncbi:MAG: hypothetical protein AABW89_05840 [Nanoarchaeota archaeon]